MSKCLCQYDFFELADGRVWSVEDSRFTDVCSAMANASTCFVLDDAHLVKTLREEGYPLGEYEGYEPAAQDVLAMRDMLLRELQRKFEELEEYRLKLLDVESQPGFPSRIDWPERPW